MIFPARDENPRTRLLRNDRNNQVCVQILKNWNRVIKVSYRNLSIANFVIKSEILYSLVPFRAIVIFFALPRPFGRLKAGDHVRDCTTQKNTSRTNSGDRVFVACAHRPTTNIPHADCYPPLGGTSPCLPLLRRFRRVIDVWIKGVPLWGREVTPSVVLRWWGRTSCLSYTCSFLMSCLRYDESFISSSLFLSSFFFFFPLFYLALPAAAGNVEGIQSEGKAGREIKTWWGVFLRLRREGERQWRSKKEQMAMKTEAAAKTETELISGTHPRTKHKWTLILRVEFALPSVWRAEEAISFLCLIVFSSKNSLFKLTKYFFSSKQIKYLRELKNNKNFWINLQDITYILSRIFDQFDRSS